MLKFVRRLLKGQSTSPTSPGIQEPQSRQLDESQLEAIESLARLAYGHLPAAAATASAAVLVEQYIGGESLFACLRSADAEAADLVYLYVDQGEVEEASSQAVLVARSHGLSEGAGFDAQTSVSALLRAYDIWLTAQGFRFVQHRAVDWGFSGLVLPSTAVPSFLHFASRLEETFLEGCAD